MSEGDQRVELVLADLASEYWKLLKNYDHVITAAPEHLRSGLLAQAKFGARRLASILEMAGMRLETFDGIEYSTNLPVSAVNADEFSVEAHPVVEQTLEPAIVQGGVAIRPGRVYLAAANKEADGVSRH